MLDNVRRSVRLNFPDRFGKYLILLTWRYIDDIFHSHISLQCMMCFQLTTGVQCARLTPPNSERGATYIYIRDACIKLVYCPCHTMHVSSYMYITLDRVCMRVSSCMHHANSCDSFGFTNFCPIMHINRTYVVADLADALLGPSLIFKKSRNSSGARQRQCGRQVEPTSETGTGAGFCSAKANQSSGRSPCARAVQRSFITASVVGQSNPSPADKWSFCIRRMICWRIIMETDRTECGMGRGVWNGTRGVWNGKTGGCPASMEPCSPAGQCLGWSFPIAAVSMVWGWDQNEYRGSVVDETERGRDRSVTYPYIGI